MSQGRAPGRLLTPGSSLRPWATSRKRRSQFPEGKYRQPAGICLAPSCAPEHDDAEAALRVVQHHGRVSREISRMPDGNGIGPAVGLKAEPVPVIQCWIRGDGYVVAKLPAFRSQHAVRTEAHLE